MFLHFLFNMHIRDRKTLIMKTQLTLILQWEQPNNTEKGKGKDQKPNKEWRRPGEALGSGNCVPSPLCVFSLILADGSAFVEVFFFLINVSEEGKERGRDSLRERGRMGRLGV